MDEFKMCCGTTCDKRKVQEQIDALVAQLAALQRAVKAIQDTPEPRTEKEAREDRRLWNVLAGVMAATPATCLAQHDAEVARKSFDDGYGAGYQAGRVGADNHSLDESLDHAERIRAGGAS